MAHIIFTLALLMHGAGHILFVANSWGYWRSETAQGWLLGPVLPMSRIAEGIMGLLWLVPLAGFLIGAGRYYAGLEGWPVVLLFSAALSSILVLLWWGDINPSSATFALLFNIIVIVAAIWQQQGLATISN